MNAQELAKMIYEEDLGVKKQYELIKKYAPIGKIVEYGHAVSTELYNLAYGIKKDRYMVWFHDCPEQIFFDNSRDARHYARHNGGIVKDLETGENIYNYSDPDLNTIAL